jgi:hypothetical protein
MWVNSLGYSGFKYYPKEIKGIQFTLLTQFGWLSGGSCRQGSLAQCDRFHYKAGGAPSTLSGWNPGTRY